ATLPDGAAPDSRADGLDRMLGLSDTHRPWVTELNNTRNLCIRTPRWKFISASPYPTEIGWGAIGVDGPILTGNQPYDQLFDMQGDPGETTNVADRYPDIAAAMKELLIEAGR
ncbi:MAG: arylsulfatase, partial [Paramuribaculum sp.]|nr:arylsulfatase [Paramuribaculum sp.]